MLLRHILEAIRSSLILEFIFMYITFSKNCMPTHYKEKLLPLMKESRVGCISALHKLDKSLLSTTQNFEYEYCIKLVQMLNEFLDK